MVSEKYISTLARSVTAAAHGIANVRKEDSFVFLTFSDLHMRTMEEDGVQKLLSTLEAAAAAIHPDAVINLGDNPNMLGREIHISNEELATLFTQLFDSIQAAIRCPLLLIHGNHDAPGTDFFDADFWNALTKGHYGHTEAVYDSEGSYCYWDIPRANTRLISLSMPCGSDVEAEMPTPLWGFGCRQLQWLANTALDTQSQVILLVHVPLFYDYLGNTTSTLAVWTGQRAAVSLIKDLCGEIADRDTVIGILDAFDRHQAYDRGELGIHLKPSAETAGLAACFSGHTHEDSFWEPKQTQGRYTNHLPCHQVVIKTATIGCHQDGISMDAVVWTPSEGSFHIFRIGDGENRHFSIQ